MAQSLFISGFVYDQTPIAEAIILLSVFPLLKLDALFLAQVFALGTNCSGCLGLGDVQSTIEARRIDVLCGKKIVSLSYGTGPHVVIATAGET